MGYHHCQIVRAMPLIRPKLLIETARIGARLYQRGRDLGGTLAGTGARPSPGQIVACLTAAEQDCEAMRRARSPAYRPGRHVQVLAALLAESGDGDQAKASGSEALRRAM